MGEQSPNRQSMFHNKAEAWGARANAKVGANWERGWKGRVDGILLMSSALLPTFLGLAITHIGGVSMTILWVVLTVLSAWILVACIWLNTRYSGRSQDKRMARVEKNLSEIAKSLSEITKSLGSLTERDNKNGKL